MELLEELKELEKRLEQEAIQKQEDCKILDISCYNIQFDAIEGEEGPLFLVEKEVNGEVKRELQIGDKVIADIGEDNHVQMREGFLDEKTILLIQLRDVMPTSLRELEEIEMRKERSGERSNKEQEKTSRSKEDKKKLEEEGEIPKKRENAKDIEIDLNKKITETKTFADLVPEVKEKHVTTVKVRRLDATRYEFYGETIDEQEVALESLKTVEGTNPTNKINQVGENRRGRTR